MIRLNVHLLQAFFYQINPVNFGAKVLHIIRKTGIKLNKLTDFHYSVIPTKHLKKINTHLIDN